MAVDLNETIVRIRKAGPTMVRAVPMPGQAVHGDKYQIEICESGQWSAIVQGLPHNAANDIIQQAVNRVICG